MINKSITALLVVLLLLGVAHGLVAQTTGKYKAVYSEIPWLDDQGKVVSAHGANIIQDQGKFYLFGEAHTDTSNAFVGFYCYSSADLYNWKFESVALPVQKSGKLGTGRVGERPKVMKCPKTGEYIMYMHVDTLGYRDQFIGYATANKITGPYTFKGPILFEDKLIRKWDMGTFQDNDDSGYLLIHSGNIYKLSDDYKSVAEHVVRNVESEGESPAIFRKGETYYWLASHRTSWERNDNFYYTATSLKGPWTRRGPFAPEGSLTWNSQTTFVLPIAGSKDTTYMFMGDRWSFPKQASAATYVWQPLTISGTSLSIPQFLEAWQINPSIGVSSPMVNVGKTIENTDSQVISFTGKWQQAASETVTESSSDTKDASFSVKFKGTQVGFYGLARPDGGYARVILRNSKGKIIQNSIVDMYSKYPISTLRFQSPILPKDSYTLNVSVMAERGNWTDKRRTLYGSTGYFVSLDKVVIQE